MRRLVLHLANIAALCHVTICKPGEPGLWRERTASSCTAPGQGLEKSQTAQVMDYGNRGEKKIGEPLFG